MEIFYYFILQILYCTGIDWFEIGYHACNFMITWHIIQLFQMLPNLGSQKCSFLVGNKCICDSAKAADVGT